MNSNPWYVVGGFFIFALIGFLLVSLYTLGFLKIVKVKTEKIWLPLLIASTGWLVATIFAVMFVSGSGLLIFSLTIMTLFLTAGFLTAYKVLRLSLWQAIFYTIGFSVIINPIWYFLF
jgi:hypothetical protein